MTVDDPTPDLHRCHGAHGKVKAVEPKGHHQKRLPKINSLMETITAAVSKKHAHIWMGKNAEL
jgi:hypothetical protein